MHEIHYYMFTAHKRSLRKGNVFTHVCHSVHGGHTWPGGMHGGGHVWQGGMCGGGMHGRGARQGACMVGVCMAGDVCGSGDVWKGHAWGTCMAGETATTAGGTHPTGMHSCSISAYKKIWLIFIM